MMSKLLITTHWTADEAETILSFIDELREAILVGYEVEIQEAHYLKMESAEAQEQEEDLNDSIPF